jgi:hypothetical protein
MTINDKKIEVRKTDLRTSIFLLEPAITSTTTIAD